MKKEPIVKNKFNPFSNIWVVLIIMIIGFQLFNNMTIQEQSQTLSYNQFKNKIEQNIIKEIRINGDQVITLFRT